MSSLLPNNKPCDGFLVDVFCMKLTTEYVLNIILNLIIYFKRFKYTLMWIFPAFFMSVWKYITGHLSTLRGVISINSIDRIP